MELKKSSSILFFLNGLIAIVISILGVWWLYLIFGLSNRLQLLEGNIGEGPDFARLIKWEGSAFIILLLIITISHMILFLKDQKKNKAIHAFFAGLTHELKTPLASIRLQAEVIKDESERLESERLDRLTDRLIDDTSRLEIQMDKILQLSRLERGGNLNIKPVETYSFIQRIIKASAPKIPIEITGLEENIEVLADEFALELVFKNLFENTKNHTSSQKIQINAYTKDGLLNVQYKDDGEFAGDIKKLGNLFYKHNSSKGSGIGLYLSKRLLKKMNGSLAITKDKGLIFDIALPIYREETQIEGKN